MADRIGHCGAHTNGDGRSYAYEDKSAADAAHVWAEYAQMAENYPRENGTRLVLYVISNFMSPCPGLKSKYFWRHYLDHELDVASSTVAPLRVMILILRPSIANYATSFAQLPML